METSPSAGSLRPFDSIIRKPPRAEASLTSVARNVELAAALGARFVRVFGDVLPSGPPAARAAALEPIAEGLNRLGEFAGTMQVRVVLETHGDFSDSHRGRRADAANSVAVRGHSLGYASSLEVLRRAAGPNVGSPAAVGLAHALEGLGQPPRRSSTRIVDRPRTIFGRDGGTRPDERPSRGGLRPVRRRRIPRGGMRAATEDVRLRRLAQSRVGEMWHPQLEVPEVALPLFANKMRALWERL